MLNLAVQVSVQTEYLQTKKTKRGQNKENCLSLFHLKDRKKDRHKLNRKTRYWIDFFKQENYLLTSLEDIFKNSLSGGRETSYIALRIDNKNLFFFKEKNRWGLLFGKTERLLIFTSSLKREGRVRKDLKRKTQTIQKEMAGN
jgi:hypothetical protein